MHLTRVELSQLIERIAQELGIPCEYYQFETAQAPPFFVWFMSENTDIKADNENYVDKEVFNLELYTAYKDFELEKKLEDILKSSGFCYSKESNFIDSEKCYQIAYESEVIING